MKNRFMLATAILCGASVGLAGQGTPTVDGSITGGDIAIYGSAVATQNSQTGFGDSNNGTLFANGSELDQMYLAWDSTNLYVMLTGNLETNGNSIVLLVDNTNLGTGVSGTFTGVNGGDNYFQTNGAGVGMGGTVFPTGMNVDYLLLVKCFNSPLEWRYQKANLTNSTTAAFGNFSTGATTNPAINSQNGYTFALNNANTAGVDAGSGATVGNPATVTTGLELAIPLSEIPGTPTLNPSTGMKIFASVTNGGADFFANQTLPPGTPRGNDGGDPNYSALSGSSFTLPVNVSVYELE